MGRIFLSAGHSGYVSNSTDPGVVVSGTTEAREMILLRDMVVTELRSRSFEVLSVPDDLGAIQTIAWINARDQVGDVALELHADAVSNGVIRGASVFYIASNDERRRHAELLLLALLRRVPQLPNRGAKSDTAIGIGSLGFCRQVIPPSLLMEVGVLTNPDDRYILQNRRREMALGIADGLAAWSRTVAGISPNPIAPPAPTPSPVPSPAPPAPPAPGAYLPINININGQNYGEMGILINGNAYIPIDLADRLGIDLSQTSHVRKISYRYVVYVKAIELREYNLSVAWNSSSRTIFLRSALQLCPGLIDRISGHGNTSEVQMLMFLKATNEAAISQFPEMAKLYREEGMVEGVNYDIAFAQMCVETNFLRFGATTQPNQYNFAGLGSVGGGAEVASFPNARIGVRAHIQHLKAYANTEPLVQDLVDPRFRFVTRGIAPLIGQLSGRWSADVSYGDRIMATLRRLYETAGLL
jgi:hypothetical protein